MQSHTILFMECGFVVSVYMEQQERPRWYIYPQPHNTQQLTSIAFFLSLSRSLHNDSLCSSSASPKSPHCVSWVFGNRFERDRSHTQTNTTQ